ncbi:MAG: hypothetical protein V4773_04765, partial [Verrucomicrobiota bacterium]
MFTVIGDPELNRTRLFSLAAQAEGVEVDVLPYARILAGRRDWPATLTGRQVRLESPGRDFEVERALLARGAAFEADAPFARISTDALQALPRDPGLILATRQWYLGWRDLLAEIARAGSEVGAAFLNAPSDIAVMFDKVACHALLAQAGVPVPCALPPPGSFDELLASLGMSARKHHRP